MENNRTDDDSDNDIKDERTFNANIFSFYVDLEERSIKRQFSQIVLLWLAHRNPFSRTIPPFVFIFFICKNIHCFVILSIIFVYS